MWGNSPGNFALRRGDAAIPIVFTIMADPGGNVTGSGEWIAAHAHGRSGGMNGNRAKPLRGCAPSSTAADGSFRSSPISRNAKRLQALLQRAITCLPRCKKDRQDLDLKARHAAPTSIGYR
jgi:hypothetical protein